MQLVQSTMWQAIEERLAITTNPRHRAMLEVVIAHARAEADRSVERLMATLVDDPQYHFWVGGRDVGPKGRTAVVVYYEQFVGSGGAVFESPKDRLVVDDHNVVSEAEVRTSYPARSEAAWLPRPRRVGALRSVVPQRGVLRVRRRSDPGSG